LRFEALEEFERSEIAEGQMRAHDVVDVFPTAQLKMEVRDGAAVGDQLIELLVVGAMRAFDVAVEFGRARTLHRSSQ
jgi:hypothetical protein